MKRKVSVLLGVRKNGRLFVVHFRIKYYQALVKGKESRVSSRISYRIRMRKMYLKLCELLLFIKSNRPVRVRRRKTVVLGYCASIMYVYISPKLIDGIMALV